MNALQESAHLCLRYLVILLLAGCASQDQAIKLFTTDGCSLFPDGEIARRKCCLNHDLHYWQGGSKRDRKEADVAFKQCVQSASDSRLLAATMYRGVRIGVHPVLPTKFRWGYGWAYGRLYRPLNQMERNSIAESLADLHEAVVTSCSQSIEFSCADVEAMPTESKQ
mgnify:FL=1